jgi:hypothetical protein
MEAELYDTVKHGAGNLIRDVMWGINLRTTRDHCEMARGITMMKNYLEAMEEQRGGQKHRRSIRKGI